MKRVTKGIERGLTGILSQPRTEQTFWALVEPWYPKLLGVAERSGRGTDCDPREVVHHAILQALNGWAGFRGRSSPEAWVWMCRYVNGSLSWFRRGRSEPRGDLSGVEATDGDVVACVDAREGLLQVERLLSPRQRRVLRNLFGGKSTRDMARELRVSPQSVRRTVTRVRNRFCTRLLAWGAA